MTSSADSAAAGLPRCAGIVLGSAAAVMALRWEGDYAEVEIEAEAESGLAVDESILRVDDESKPEVADSATSRALRCSPSTAWIWGKLRPPAPDGPLVLTAPSGVGE